MTAPIGIQRQRTAGWCMPPNTVSVCRPGQWGNPFRIGDVLMQDGSEMVIADADTAMRLFRNMRADRNYPSDQAIQRELRGKNLACWCAIGSPCHRNVLLEIANA